MAVTKVYSVQVIDGELPENVIHLEVRAGNETAIRLYERQGFVRDGLRKGYYTDPTEDAVLMTRTAVSE